MLEVLAAVGACRDEPFSALHRLVLSRADALSGCLAVLLGWDEARQAFVRDLARQGIPTIALPVTGRGDRLSPTMLGLDVRIHPVALDHLAPDLATL
jgi:hypothetical protein